MASLTQRIGTYSFLDRPSVDISVVDTTDTDAALLSQINSLLNSAASSFAARDYSDALNTYFACESLIYAHLDPQWNPALASKFRPLLPRDPSLFGPLLSATCQWLDILPVAVSVSPVRPSTPVTAQLLSSVSGLYGAGISQVSANPAATAQALSDMHLAAIFADQGNTAASTAAIARAQSLDPVVAAALAPPGSVAPAPVTPGASAPVAPVAPAPVAPTAPAAPVVPTTPGGVKLPAVASPAAEPMAAMTTATSDVSLTTSSVRLPGLSSITVMAPVLTLPQLPSPCWPSGRPGYSPGPGRHSPSARCNGRRRGAPASRRSRAPCTPRM